LGYELGVTEVGPAEYPLIEVLRKTIFDEVGHVSLATIAEDLEGKTDVLALIAHLEGNPIGFKVGHRERAGVYYSKCGGILKDYRRLGLATRMLDWQHRFAQSRGYKQIYFNTFNHFPAMMLFGLRHGYLPAAAEMRERGGMSFIFSRALEDAAQSAAAIQPVNAPSQPSFELEQSDASGLYNAVSTGYLLTGIRHDFKNGKTFVILNRKEGGDAHLPASLTSATG
jgi:GNAT superfamily N-acetyltransferase